MSSCIIIEEETVNEWTEWTYSIAGSDRRPDTASNPDPWNDSHYRWLGIVSQDGTYRIQSAYSAGPNLLFNILRLVINREFKSLDYGGSGQASGCQYPSSAN